MSEVLEDQSSVDPLTGSKQRCKCGWLVPNNKTLTITLNREEGCEHDYEVAEVEMACPECGNVFAVDGLVPLVIH